MPVDSLLDIATRACGRICKRIKDVGDIPYDLIRPILFKIDSPEQLHLLEQNSPQLIGRDAEIWLGLIRRDIPDWESKMLEPKDPRNWYKVYRRLKQESEMDMSHGEEKLRAAMDVVRTEREQNVTQLVKGADLPRPRQGLRASINYKYKSGITGSKGAQKLSLMEKIKKEAREARALRLATEARQRLTQGKTMSQISRPPQQFLEEARKTEDIKKLRNDGPSSSPERAIRAPRKSVHRDEPTHAQELTFKEIQDREARLRALAAGRGPPDIKATSEPEKELPRTPAKPSNTVTEDTASPPAKGNLSESFLESSNSPPDPPDNGRQVLRRVEDPERSHRLASPGRISSPQPASRLKRKGGASIFMSPSRNKIPRHAEIN